MKEGALVTADGSVYRGHSVGAEGVSVGEVVFNTAMTGYQEIITDPSYAGQLVAMTATHIGNYGTNGHDDQAPRTHAVGLITRSLSRMDSSWRSSGGLQEALTDRGLIVLTEIDTRRLTRHVRERGAMPAAVGTDVDVADLVAIAADAPGMEGRDLVTTVTTDRPYRAEPDHTPRAHIVAYDFGIKRDIVRSMTARGAAVTVVPASTSAGAVLDLDPDAVFLSNGPGDPEPLSGPIAAVRSLLGRVPIFGICLGHQILGLALGASTFKLPFGHHGGNHPVQRLTDGRVEITAQNHGFAVDPGTVSGDFGRVIPTHRNLNDGTLEGLRCPDIDAFSVQYHPEAAPGPHDATSLFDAFLDGAADAA